MRCLQALLLLSVPLLFALPLNRKTPTTKREDASSKAPDHPEKRFPDAIIIGVKKAGTRALLEFLRLNPHVKAPGPEVHFFDRHYDNGLDWYRNQMPATSSSDVTIEKSPAYFINTAAPERIKQFNPKMKLIVVLRDPVTRAISDYTQASSKKRRIGQMPTFERMAVGDCAPWSRANCSVKTRGVNAEWGALRIGKYHKYLKRWFAQFPVDQFHFVDGEQLVSDPAAEVRKVEQFLGLAPVVRSSNFAVDPVKKFPCVKKDNGSLHCLGKTKGRPHPKVEEPVLKRLKRFYQPENEQLFDLIHKRFDWD